MCAKKSHRGHSPYNRSIGGATIARCAPGIFTLMFVFSIAGRAAVALKLTNMTAPAIADPREDLDLDCHFDMGIEKLYAVKWYKDDQEFFRYMPYQQPHVKMFPVAGVHMLPHETSCGQSRCKVRLTGLTRDHSGGAYRCEVSSDAPAFRLASETHNVTVAVLPKVNPVIVGLRDSYQLGDVLAVECRSSAGDPIPELNWYINDVKAPSNIVGDSISSSPKDDGLEHRTVTLRFQIDRKYTQGNFIRLRCVSTVFGIPVSPQTVIRNVAVKAQPTTQVNNEKLHWPDVSSNKPKLQINSSLLCYCYCTVIAYFSFRIRAEL